MLQLPRILFVSNDVLGWTGYGNQLSAALAGREDLVYSVLRRRAPRFLNVLARRHTDTSLSRLLRPLDPIRAHGGFLGRDIRKAVARAKPDLVHVAAHWPAGALLSDAARPLFTVALDCTRANVLPSTRRSSWPAKDLASEKHLLTRAAHVFPMSDYAASSLTIDYGIPLENITVLPPSIPTEDWPRPSELTGAPAQILFVGNNLKRKGAKRLLEWVDGPLKGRCHLHIVSTEPPEDLASPNLTFHGRVPHHRLLTEIFPTMDIFCLPTGLDMSPHVLVEAAAAGLPCVTSRICGIPELVLDGETGFVLAPDDSAAFVDALSRLVADESLRRRMGRAARHHACAKFRGERNFARLIDTLITLVNDTKPLR